MKVQIAKGREEVILHVFIQDSTSTTGAGLAGLTSSSGIVGGYVRNGELGLPLVVDETATLGTWAEPTAANQVRIGTPANQRPGIYELHFRNELWATGVDTCMISLGGAANMADLILEVQLTQWDPNNSGWSTLFENLGAVHLDTADAATAGTITLGAVSDTVPANLHQWKKITIISGPGAGQSRIIISHTAGPNAVATIDHDWTATAVPDATSRYRIEDTALSRLTNSTHGGNATTITFGTSDLNQTRVGNLDSLDADVSSRATQVTADAIEADTQDIQSTVNTNLDVVLSTRSSHTPGDVTADMDANSADLTTIINAIAALQDISVADILAASIETGAVPVNLAEALRAMLATTAGTSPAPVTGRRTYESPNGVARVAMDVSAGNRSNPTYTLTP